MGLINHCWQYARDGFGDLWCQAGVAATKRFISIDTLAGRMGTELCNVLPNMHDLTGCGKTSKGETKLSRKKQLPKADLMDFGKDP